MADFKDDFEFKPLTEGLGFHKKVIDIKDVPERIGAGAPRPKVSPESFWTPQLRNKTFADKKSQAVVVGKSPEVKVQDHRLSPSAASWPAAVFDSTMVLGIVLIFSAVIFAVTGIDFSQLIEMLSNEGTAQLGALVLLISVYEIYTVSSRTFFGKTVGEAVFDSRLGTPEAQQKLYYPLQVAFRSFVIALTGFVTLPLLSTIFNYDLAGLISGVSLYTEKR